jgi:probable rRNA maturation factor
LNVALSLLIDESVEEVLNVSSAERLERQLSRMLAAASLQEDIDEELEMDVRLTDDPCIHELNRDYRDKDKPTDVLAFSQREGEFGHLNPHILGDVIISLDTAARQAKQGLYEEVVFLAAHGLCHLLGYDHQDDEEERAMNARMNALIEESRREGEIKGA